MPRGRIGVFKVCHKHACTGVERVDDHLAIDRPRDFNPPILQIHRSFRNPPVTIADCLGLLWELRQLPRAQRQLPLAARRQQFAPPRAKLVLQLRHKLQRFDAEHVRKLGRRRHFQLQTTCGNF